MGNNLKFGIDTITLYSPSYWGLNKWWDFQDPEVISPENFWDKALDTVVEMGAEGLRLSFGPARWRYALKRYGTAEKFQGALQQRGLELAGVLFVEMGTGDMFDPKRQQEIISEVSACADFVKAAGADIIAVSLPHRRMWSDDPPLFVDADYVKGLANLLNRMGYETLKRGVRLALHPKVHGTLFLKRDIDLYMLFTDPLYVNFCPDTSHISFGGSDPIRIIDEHRARVIMTDWKDIRRTVPWHFKIDKDHLVNMHPHYAFVGEGLVDWTGWIKKLREIDYKGWAIVELDATESPIEQTKKAFSFIEKNMSPIYR